MDVSKKLAAAILMIILSGLRAKSIQGQDTNDYKPLFPPSTQIIDVVHYLFEADTSGLWILTVDADGRVGSTQFRRKSDKGFAKAAYEVLGQALSASGELSLRGRIPANEIAIAETRLTNPSTGTRFHAVVTVFLAKSPHNRHMGKVYLFAEKGQQISLALTKEYGDSPKAMLDDINGDGMPELAVQFVEDTGKAGDLDIWSISSDDKLTKLEFPDDGAYTSAARTYFRHFEERYDGPGNYAVVATASILRNAIPIEREVRFQWNNEAKRYLITAVTDVSETRRRIPLR